jgi:membrane protein implicated in regulation of membrane protease activity
MIIAAILFALEVISPGIFLMWFGMAAAVTGILAFLFDIGWQWQLVWFCLLSLAAVLIALNYLRRNPLQSDRPLLNERAVQHIGQSYEPHRSDREWARQRQDRRFDLARGGT